jgi:hypothetical protein
MVGTLRLAHPTIMPNVITKKQSCGSLFAVSGSRSVIYAKTSGKQRGSPPFSP